MLQRCLVEILWATGMRRAEVLGLAYDAVDLSGGLLRVLGKGNKERVVPMAPGLTASLASYKNVRSSIAAPEGAFFRLPNGKPLYAAYVYRVVKNVLGAHTQLKKRSPHVLRHSFATHVLDAGADLNAIKTMLGHANLAATQVYTHNTISKLKHVHGKAHPRGGDEG
jgi:integrase/recombinase XerC